MKIVRLDVDEDYEEDVDDEDNCPVTSSAQDDSTSELLRFL